jgi:hypothetical protein
VVNRCPYVWTWDIVHKDKFVQKVFSIDIWFALTTYVYVRGAS